MSEALSLLATRWPRLYLDTAEILYIADDRADKVLLAALLAAMRERGVLLVLGIQHFDDAIPRADADAASKLADALEMFPIRMVATKEPSEVEPWSGTVGDIVIEPAPNIRELVTAPAAQPTLHRRASAANILHAGNLQHQQARLEHTGTPLSRREHEIFLQSLVALVSGQLGTDADTILAHYEREGGSALEESGRRKLRELLAAPAQVMGEMTNRFAFTPDQRVSMLEQLRVSFDPEAYRHSPGLFLASRVANCRAKNLGRVPQASDQIDGQHASYFPYVDIATCDRQTHACVFPHLGKDTFPRKVTLVRNGRLNEVLAAVERLPAVPPLID